MFALSRSLDGIAIALTGLCLVHCLVLPLALMLLPLLGAGVLAGTAFHQAMVGLVLPTSAVALISGCRRHRRTLVFRLGGTGVGLLVVTAFVLEPAWGEIAGRIGTTAGGLMLAAAHVTNFRLCRAAACPQPH